MVILRAYMLLNIKLTIFKTLHFFFQGKVAQLNPFRAITIKL